MYHLNTQTILIFVEKDSETGKKVAEFGNKLDRFRFIRSDRLCNKQLGEYIWLDLIRRFGTMHWNPLRTLKASCLDWADVTSHQKCVCLRSACILAFGGYSVGVTAKNRDRAWKGK